MKTMTRFSLSAAGAILGTLLVTASAADDSIAPQRLPSTRYAKLRTELPFSVATAAEKPEEPTVSWAQNLYLGSVARSSLGGTDQDWVIVKDRTQPGVLIVLDGYEPNNDGYQLVKLEYSDDPKKTRASIKKGGEFATLEPDQAAYTSSAPVPPPAAAPRSPGVAVPGSSQVPAPGGIRPAVPTNPSIRPPSPAIPRPNVPPAVPQQVRPLPLPGQATVPGQQPQNPAVANRPRTRVINSRP